MELALKRYGSYEKFELATGGALVTESRIWQTIKKYMEKEGCFGEVGWTLRLSRLACPAAATAR